MAIFVKARSRTPAAAPGLRSIICSRIARALRYLSNGSAKRLLLLVLHPNPGQWFIDQLDGMALSDSQPHAPILGKAPFSRFIE